MRLRRLAGDEAGMTLIELLVAATMSVVLVGAAGSMLISAVRAQPELSEKAQNISTARWVLERLTREIRNGIAVEAATATSVTFRARVRRTECGGGVQEEASKPAIQCKVTYSCTAEACSRAEAEVGAEGTGTPVTIVSGLDNGNVFAYDPPIEGGEPSEISYIGITLSIPDPDGEGDLTVTDGANLRTVSLEG